MESLGKKLVNQPAHARPPLQRRFQRCKSARRPAQALHQTSAISCSFLHKQPLRRRSDCQLCRSDRTASPPADTMSQPVSPDHTAVIEHSEQFKVHLKAAILDPEVSERNQVTPEIEKLIEELKSVQPQDRKKLTKEALSGVFQAVLTDFKTIKSDGRIELGTLSFQQFKPAKLKVKVGKGISMDVGQTRANQYQVNVPLTVEEGPLQGMPAVYSTVGDFSLDESSPVRQEIAFTNLVLRPNTQDNSQLQRWKEVMKKENDTMAEDGSLSWSSPAPMKGFRDFLYYDNELQVAIGNNGGLTILQKGGRSAAGVA